jgi:hypothetical protein
METNMKEALDILSRNGSVTLRPGVQVVRDPSVPQATFVHVAIPELLMNTRDYQDFLLNLYLWMGGEALNTPVTEYEPTVNFMGEGPGKHLANQFNKWNGCG